MQKLTVLNSEIEKQAILKDIIIQLNKDLALSNVAFEFKSDSNFEDFWLDLVAVVRELLNRQYEKYLHFIYRIDINEKDLIATDIAPFEEVEAFIAYQIIRRIYKKVYFRKNFERNRQFYFKDLNGYCKII